MWDKKTIYHSNLRAKSPVTLMFTKGVRKSKFEDRQDFAPFKLPDDPEDYTYQIENEECAAAIRSAPRNTWLLVSAEGMEGEARLIVTNPDGSEVKAKGKRKGGGRAKSSDAPGSVEEGFWEALCLARDLRDRYEAEFGDELEPLIKEFATSIYINWERGGFMALRVSDVAQPAPEDIDPAEPVELTTLQQIEDLLEKVELEDNIRERIDTLVESGMTQKTAISTLTYLRGRPAKQEKLPWEEEEEDG